ncbi:MAG TPA: DUF485 domain-containing protein [Nocardioides sp.]|nr:DUF485 domain-containing protein [uncultured Nocardioides sp.]HEX5986180.1 DUF485 domain-containing protein [Nocardioides sp.]
MAETPHQTSGHAIYAELASTDEFKTLRKRYRGFAIPATVAFLLWYFLYVLMSTFAEDFMATKVVGNINVALIFGLLQFLSTFLIAYMYSRYANKNFDPIAADLQGRYDREVR